MHIVCAQWGGGRVNVADIVRALEKIDSVYCASHLERDTPT